MKKRLAERQAIKASQQETEPKHGSNAKVPSANPLRVTSGKEPKSIVRITLTAKRRNVRISPISLGPTKI